MTRISGTTFTDDAPIPGTKAEKIQNLERELASQNQALGHANIKVNQLMDENTKLKADLVLARDLIRTLESQVNRYKDEDRERRVRVYGEDI